MRREMTGPPIYALFIIAACVASADEIDPELSRTEFLNGPIPVTVALFNIPDGSGNSFTQAVGVNGTAYDATILLSLRDVGNQPIADYPAEDLWILPVPDWYGTYFACTNGTIPDADTDENGQTVWQNPLRAGGYTSLIEDVTQVFVAGAPLVNPGLPVNFNSADITGDGIVNLSDIGVFSQDFYGSYQFRSDFVFDVTLNLSDIGALAQGNGTACP